MVLVYYKFNFNYSQLVIFVFLKVDKNLCCALFIYLSLSIHLFISPVNKQINDKERVAAAMENPNLREIVEQCVIEPDD